jgi:hypothetical protein
LPSAPPPPLALPEPSKPAMDWEEREPRDDGAPRNGVPAAG